MKELEKYSRWITYRTAIKANGELDKIPCDFRGYRISAVEPVNWHSFSTISRFENKGFVLNGDGIACLDSDKFLVTPKQEQRVMCELLADCPNEVSISGKGLHHWFRTDLTSSLISHELGIELYVAKRFIALGTVVADRELPFIPGDVLLNVWNSFEHKKSKVVETVEPKAVSADVESLLNAVKTGNFGYENGQRMNGNLSFDGGDWSKAALRLANSMAYHSGNNVNLMIAAMRSCVGLLAQRPDRDNHNRWGKQTWIEGLCSYACK